MHGPHDEERRDEDRQETRGRVPDIVIVKEPARPPTGDNIEKVIEVKFASAKEAEDGR